MQEGNLTPVKCCQFPDIALKPQAWPLHAAYGKWTNKTAKMAVRIGVTGVEMGSEKMEDGRQ